MLSLQDKVIIVTGAGRGIGRAMVRRFVAAGARVVAASTSPEPLQSLAAELPAGSVLPFPMDVRSYDQAQALAAAALDRFGRIDILVNNAGVARHQRLEEMDPETWRWTLDVNLTGVFHCTRAVLPHLLARAREGGERPAGQILNIGSVLGRNPARGVSAYAAAKAALQHLTECWKLELEPEGIRVLLLAPGLTQTDFGGRPAASKVGGMQPETVAEVAYQMLTLPPDATLGPVFLPHAGAMGAGQGRKRAVL